MDVKDRVLRIGCWGVCAEDRALGCLWEDEVWVWKIGYWGVGVEDRVLGCGCGRWGVDTEDRV